MKPRWSKITYETVAQVLYEHLEVFLPHWSNLTPYQEGNVAALNETMVKLAARFKEDNPAFDRARFYEACNTGKGIRASLRLVR